jgi:ABC-type multidrug transport system fused ATPase/permease subunit
LAYNKPVAFIFTGVLGSIGVGSSMPITGIILSELLTYLTSPWDRLGFMAAADSDFTVVNPKDAGKEYLEAQIKFYSSMMGVIALASGIFSIVQKGSFGFLGENTTFEIRKKLYDTIMRKNIGWFDNKENGVSILTSAMA